MEVVAPDVFISYSSHDDGQGHAVCAKLEGNGIRCWIAPRDIVPGREWGESIVDAIHHARIMVLVFSGNANKSPQVRREVERAVNSDLVIIPFRIEAVLPEKSLEYFLSTSQWFDAIGLPFEGHLNRLSEVVAGTLSSLIPRDQGDAAAHAGSLIGELPTFLIKDIDLRPEERDLQKPKGLRRVIPQGTPVSPWTQLEQIRKRLEPGERVVAFASYLLPAKHFGADVTSTAKDSAVAVSSSRLLRVEYQAFTEKYKVYGDRFSTIAEWALTERRPDERFHFLEQWWRGGLNFGVTIRIPSNGSLVHLAYFAPAFCRRYMEGVAAALRTVMPPTAPNLQI